MDNLSSTLDQLAKKRGLEERDRKRAMFHKIRMKKALMLEKLNDYLDMLQKKQQDRLIEEYSSSFRNFKYAGPTREGPLFCLRESYRRERKAWRVKYAKKYGLLCSKVRLEKRLMRKARRLLMREKILNALKDKSRSKLMILLEMKKEFNRLVERLKLNKEIQEKIKRQDKMAKSQQIQKKPEQVDKPPANNDRSVSFAQVSKKDRSKSTFGQVESLTSVKQDRSKSVFSKAEIETQKSPNVKITTSEISNISALTPLPSAPGTSQSSLIKLPLIKKPFLKAPSGGPSSGAHASSKPDTRCPPLVQDKKLGAPRCYPSLPKAKEARSVRGELPLIHEMKLGASFSQDENNKSDKSGSQASKTLAYRRALKQKEEKIEIFVPKMNNITSKKTEDPENEPSGFPQSTKPHHKKHSTKNQERKSTLIRRADAPNWPTGTILPVKVLPGGYVRQSALDAIPRNKFKKDTMGRNAFDHRKSLDIFAMQYRRAINDQLMNVFGSSRTDSFLDRVLMDVKRMSDFILDHLHLLPMRDLDYILGKLMDLKDDPRFETFKSALANVHHEPLNERVDPFKRFEIKRRAVELAEDASEYYKDFRKRIVQRRKDFRASRSKVKGRAEFKKKEKLEVKKKRRRRTLADKLLLMRTTQFHNPVRVTTKLGGRLMLQGWKPLTFEEYTCLGRKVQIYKSGWRKDGMENYEVIAPQYRMEELKYLLILNRLDLTPRRFKFPGYTFDPYILYKYIYCSNFYRSALLKKGERRLDKKQQKLSFQTEFYGGQKPQRGMVSVMGEALAEGEFTVPHLRHRIFFTPDHLLHKSKPSDKNTPMIFSLRNKFEEYSEDDPRVLKIRLQETPTLDLWEYKSTVGLRGTPEAMQYKKDHRRQTKYYQMFHRKFQRETQTILVSCIDRGTQMYAPDRDSQRTNVYEMDIVKAHVPPPQPKVKPVRRPGFQEDDSPDSSSDEGSVSSVESMPDETTKILTGRDFASSVKLTLRIMDSQLYSQKQLTFRSGLQMDPLDPKAEIVYAHERLFSFIDHRLALSEYTVTSMDWSSVNPNLLAVGYARHPLYPEQDKGLICIWNIKMITRYEKKFEFKNGVTYLQFCAPYPRLLNVALLDGSVVILDLGAKRNQIVTAKMNSVFSDYKPVWQFSWIEIGKGNYIPITCGDNGFIHQLRPDGTFQHSKFLSLGHREGKVKGIKISSSMGLKPRIRSRPGITCLEQHPTDPVTYLVGTTDGCIHICSIHFRNQHLDVFSAHIGAVKGIQFHPNCEQVFLTYGEDFYVRVWLYGTFEPALELMAGNYYVRAARWSPANAEILVSISNRFVDVWDVRRKTDVPIHRFKNPRNVENTALVFDNSGHNIVVGTISGDVYVYALKNMPFTHYFKGEAIASSMEKVLKAKKRFVKDIRKLGYPFGAYKDPSL